MIGKKPTTPAPDTAGLTTVRKSVLDAITQDARDLSVRLGSEDRQRLEKHLEGIRSLEKRLAPGQGVVSAGCQPAADPGVPPDTKAEAPPELNKAMADLVAILDARQADYARAQAEVDTSGDTVEQSLAKLARVVASCTGGAAR